MTRRPETPARSTLPAAVVLATLVLTAPAATADVLTVGTGPTCTHSDPVDAAFDARAGDTVQLEATTFVVDSLLFFVFGSGSITVEGGFTSACDGTTVAGSATTLRGNATAAVVRPVNVGWHLVLRDLVIENGSSTEGGGIDARFGELELERVVVRNNQATVEGGGLYLEEVTASLVEVEVSGNEAPKGGGLATASSILDPIAASVSGNQAGADGGGVSCTDTELFVADLSVIGNVAGLAGGGMYLGEDCDLRLSASVPREEGALLVDDNDAAEGGGLYVARHSSEFFLGRLTLTRNSATRGGGVFTDGEDFDCRRAGVVSHNVATEDGGAFHGVGVQAEAWFDRCTVESNAAGGRGGVAFLDRGRFIAQESTFVGNSAGTTGSIAFVSEPASPSGLMIVIDSMLLDTPPGAGPVLAGAPEVLEISQATLAGHASPSVLELGEIEVDLRNSIFAENAGPALAPGSGPLTGSGTCNVFDEPGELVGLQDLVVDDVGFVGGGDYHLTGESPAVDLCDGSVPGSHRDVDGDDRPQGPRRDAGADERVPVLFEDGFETGGTSAWSGS